MSSIENKYTDQLFEAILKLENKEECYKFFEDVCTVKEIHEISQRLEVAVMLKKGMNYQNISLESGASTATISRVNRCLNYGSDGYTLILERLGKGEEK